MKIKWWHYVVVIFAVSTIMCIYYALVSKYCGDLSRRGQFGDTFGAISSFFTALGFVGLVYTVWLQKKEMEIRDAEFLKQEITFIANTEQIAQSNMALSGQFKVMVLASKLTALRSLIDETVANIEKKYGNELNMLGCANIEKYGIEDLEQIAMTVRSYINVAVKIATKNPIPDSEMPFVMPIATKDDLEGIKTKLETLIGYKKEFLGCYKKLVELG